MPGRRFPGELIIALCVIALAIFLGVGTLAIGTQTFGRVGPRVFPTIVTLLLGFVGIALLFQAVTGRWRSDEIATHRLKPIGYIALGLVLDILLIERLGFVIASTILFVCVARSFESKRLVRDVIAGLIFSAVTFLLFTKVLLLNLPAGYLLGFPLN